MQKPNGYDEVKVGGGYVPPMVGGHKIVIKNVEETQSKNGRDMIKVYFDFDKTDVQPGFFTNEFKNDIRPDKKWPHGGTAYILSEDSEGNCSKKLKGFITSFERSNKCDAVWGDKFAAQFKNKKIGGVFGEVENEYNGKVTMRHELRWFCALDAVEGASVPDPVLLNNRLTPPAPKQDDDEWMNTDADGEIPWAK